MDKQDLSTKDWQDIMIETHGKDWATKSYQTIDVFKLAEQLETERAKNKVLVEALKELGHYGIDFGYGKYECDVAKTAQEALEKIKEMDNGGRDGY